MLLVLRILFYRNEPASQSAPAQFSMAGGTIGRSPGNDLVLDDPGKYISRTHARIQFRDGQFYLADLGSNPSVVNDRPLGIGREVALAAGDELVIGEYQLEVQVTAPSADATLKSGAGPAAQPERPAVPEAPAPALPLFEPPPPRPPVALPPLDALGASHPPAASPGQLPPAGMRDPLAGASILGNAGPDKRFGSQSDPLGLNLFGAPSDGRPVGAGVAGDDPLGLAFRGSASDHAAPERHAMPAATVPQPVAPASPWAAGGIPDDYDPMADFMPKAQPWPAVTPVLPAAPPAMPAAAAPEPSAAPASAAASPHYPLDAARRSSAPAQPNGYAAAQAPAVPRPAATTPAPAAAPGQDATLEALLRGLGLPDLQTKYSGPELAELVGAMLREATAGAMQTLMARSVTKRESRIEMTMIGSQANNPLKFFPDPGSALTQMLSKTAGGYMKPVRAFGNAFEDLQAHELAVMAGMHAALAAILARFDPAAIERRLDLPTVMDKMMASSRKAKMWDRLVLLYADISLEADDDFQRLFGESFAKAYEDQIERLHGREK